MNLNRLHKIFGGGSRLKREDIQNYGTSSDQRTKHAIESASLSSSFESDALEGWEHAAYNTDAMARLDKKFVPKTNGYIYLLGTAVVTVLLIGSYYLLTPPAEIQPNIEHQMITGLIEDQQVTLDESDVKLPEAIEQMTLAPQKEQVEVKVIKEDFKEKKSHPVKETSIEIESLPIIALELEQNKKAEIVRKHDLAKELYLYEFKTVDYTNYRTNPTVKINQIVLTGTPANKENEQSNDLEPIWKEAHIPYSEYLNKSMKIFGRGQYKRALTRFETIIGTYPTDVNSNFYGGLCLYNMGEYDKGIKMFNSCILGPFSNFDEEAQWMIGLSHEKLGNTNEAKKIFQSIIEQNGYYKTQAKKKLK